MSFQEKRRKELGLTNTGGFQKRRKIELGMMKEPYQIETERQKTNNYSNLLPVINNKLLESKRPIIPKIEPKPIEREAITSQARPKPAGGYLGLGDIPTQKPEDSFNLFIDPQKAIYSNILKPVQDFTSRTAASFASAAGLGAPRTLMQKYEPDNVPEFVKQLYRPAETKSEKVADVTGFLGGTFLPVSGAYATAGKLGKRGYDALTKGKELGKLGKYGSDAATGASAGLAYGLASEGLDEAINPEGAAFGQRAKRVGLETALGGVGDPLVRLAGQGLKKAYQSYKAGRISQEELTKVVRERVKDIKPLPIDQQPRNVLSRLNIDSSIPYSPRSIKSPQLSSIPKSVSKRGDIYSTSEFKKALDDQISLLKSQMGQGVVPGGLIRNDMGDVVSAYGRVSNNPKWYQDFYSSYGRKPNQTEIRQLAENQLKKGYKEAGVDIPSWQPKAIQEIDDEIASVQELIKITNDPSLNDVLELLIKGREELLEEITKPQKFNQGIQSPAKVNKKMQGELIKPFESLKDNYLKPLSEYTDTLYRETSPDSALDIIPGTNRMSDTTLDVFYFSNKPELAMGQSNNKGVMIEFDSSKIKGHLNQNKPTWQMSYKSGDAEFKSKLVKQKEYQDSVRKVTIKPDAEMDRTTRLRLNGLLDNWNKTTNADGSITYTNPVIQPTQTQREVSATVKDSLPKSVAMQSNIDISPLNVLRNKPNVQMPKITPRENVRLDPLANRTETIADGRPLLPRGDKSTVGDIVKRSDIVENLSKKLDIPFRVGKYGQKAHGIFKVKPEVIRTRLANDVPVIAHEVGHTLDKRFKLSSTAFDNELLEIGKVTSGPGYSKNEIRKEGVAEFFRMMLTDPSEAVTRAPKFYQQFASKVPSDVQQVLLDAQEQIQRYINQPVLAKSISELQIGGKERFKLPTLDDLYTKFVEELHPIKRALEPLGETGKKVFEGFRLLRGSAGRARAFLKQGVIDEKFNKIGKSFDEILAPVKENLDEARAYIKDKRALELDERGIITGSDLSRAERVFNVTELERQFPEFKTHQKELIEYQDSLLNELVKSDVLDPEDVAIFKELNKEYVPFHRDMKAEKKAKKGTQMAGSPIKRIKGSDREIVDPYESIIKNTYQYTSIAQHNKARLDLVDAITSAEGMGKFVEKIPTPMQGTKLSLDELRSVLEKAGAKTGDMDMDAVATIFRPSTHLGDNVISVFRKGKREFYELDPDLYLAVTAANQEQMSTIMRAFSFPTKVLRSGIVNTLEFWFRNMFRDPFEAAIKTDVGYIPYVDTIRGMYHVLGRTDLYTKFLARGGAQSFRQSLDRNYLQYDLRNILAKSMKDKTMNIVNPKNLLENMQALSELSETSTRMGIFAKGAQKDPSVEGLRAAAMEARDFMDFSRKGSIGKLINRAIAFWNAPVQGLDKTIRVFSDPKTAPKALAKSFAYITTPTVGLYQAFKDDPRYQELPQWDKDLFWHFWVGDTHYRLPIPFELGVIFKVIPERLMAYSEGQGESFRELGKTTFEAVDVAPWPLDIALLSPWVQAISNKTFTGAPIVPRRQQDLLPEDQIGPYTSTAAKAISKLPGIKGSVLGDTPLGSPRKVDHLIRGYTGSLGQYATQAIDAVLDIARVTEQPPRPETGLEDKAFFKGFMGKTLTGRTDSIDKFYERYSELGRQYKSARQKARGFEELGEYKQLQKIAQSMSELAEVYRAIEADPTLESKEKTEQIRELNLTTNNLARLALGLAPLSLEDFYPSKKK